MVNFSAFTYLVTNVHVRPCRYQPLHRFEVVVDGGHRQAGLPGLVDGVNVQQRSARPFVGHFGKRLLLLLS